MQMGFKRNDVYLVTTILQKARKQEKKSIGLDSMSLS